MCKNVKTTQYPNFGRVHKFGKRSIVRGVEFPLEYNGFKERPGLVISDNDSSDSIWGGVQITLLPIRSKPYSHFDIPIYNEMVYDKPRICYISVIKDWTIALSDNIKSSIFNYAVCPDNVFDLVITVKKLLLDGTNESYMKAKELVKEYRILFMKYHTIACIKYPNSRFDEYRLFQDGSEELVDTYEGRSTADTIFESTLLKNPSVLDIVKIYNTPSNNSNITDTNEEYIDNDMDDEFDTINQINDNIDDDFDSDDEDESTYIIRSNPNPLDFTPKYYRNSYNTNEEYSVKVPNKTSNQRIDTRNGNIVDDPDVNQESIYGSRYKGFVNPMTEAFQKLSLENSPNNKTEIKDKIVNKQVVEEPIKKKSIDKIEQTSSNSSSKRVSVSKSSDTELINFIKLIMVSNTSQEVANKMGVSAQTVANRFNQTIKELHRRNLDDHVIEWPFSKRR